MKTCYQHHPSHHFRGRQAPTTNTLLAPANSHSWGAVPRKEQVATAPAPSSTAGIIFDIPYFSKGKRVVHMAVGAAPGSMLEFSPGVPSLAPLPLEGYI